MAGSSNLTQAQMLECIAVLLQNISVPFPNVAGSGIHLVDSNAISIPDNAYNQNLGAQLNANVSAAGNMHLSLVEGNPASGA